MVGNDVVDLRDAEASEGAIHPRFDARAFAPCELAALARARERGALRWALWAAKEAAYKAARQRDPQVRFHPREFVVADGVVSHAAGRFRLELRRASSAIHAVAVPEGAAHASAAGFAALAPGEAPGAAARRLAIQAAARLLGCAAGELEIARDGGIPRLLRAGVACRAALSLSHHGRFAGFALALPHPAGFALGAGAGA